MSEFSSVLQLKKERKEIEEELIFLGFAVGAQSYALGVFAVREILRIPKIYSLPRVPSFVKGVIDLRCVILRERKVFARCFGTLNQSGRIRFLK